MRSWRWYDIAKYQDLVFFGIRFYSGEIHIQTFYASMPKTSPLSFWKTPIQRELQQTIWKDMLPIMDHCNAMLFLHSVIYFLYSWVKCCRLLPHLVRTVASASLPQHRWNASGLCLFDWSKSCVPPIRMVKKPISWMHDVIIILGTCGF